MIIEENKLYNKIENLKEQGVLSEEQCVELIDLYSNVLTKNEICSFVSDIYISKKINLEIEHYMN